MPLWGADLGLRSRVAPASADGARASLRAGRARHDEDSAGTDDDIRHSEPGTVVDVTDVPALRTGRIRMDFFERGFIALTVVGLWAC